MRDHGLGSWPARRARSRPGRPALLSEHGTLTYADLFARVTALAHALRGLGLGRGDRVAYLGPNRPSLVESMFAAHTLGAVFVPLNTRLATAEVDHQLQDCGASILIYSAESADVVERLTAAPLLMAVDGGAGSGHDYEESLRAAPTDPIDEPVGHDDPALILYTSGTTGSPKGATLTHGNVIWNCLNTLVELDLTSDEVTLVSAPLFHVAALNMTLLPTLLKGGVAVLMRGWDPDACFDLVERHGVTWMFGVPTMFADLARSPRWRTADLSSLRSLLAGGAPVPLQLIRTYQERGLEILQGFGLTEAAPGALILSAEMSTVKAGSAGVPHFFSDARLARPASAGTEADDAGEILVEGPTIMPGYWGRPDATATVLSEDGWLRTGDVGRMDDDGYFYIVDRIKDMYISGGENVYPAEVESQLLEHPDVEECAVIGIPDDRWGEVGCAFVRTRPGASLDREALTAFLTGRLARYKIPHTVRFVEDLPRTASGKVHKRALR
ncbi:long-chain fatty acid--CoA ligase [Actinomadura sp. NPDC049753]|uniref:acyl-CoA synthetase n=1 Tax=Actinomadura sp. NPDC049753 TaxID=3154739 RepID=UPI0034251DE4